MRRKSLSTERDEFLIAQLMRKSQFGRQVAKRLACCPVQKNFWWEDGDNFNLKKNTLVQI